MQLSHLFTSAKGPRNEATNYRPISLLSCTAKVLERLVSSALYAHTENIIPKVQSGYRRKDNTVFRLTRIVHQVSATLDKGQQALACFFDLSKAFDRVSHSQLLQKLEWYNITGSVLKWFEDYLTHRRQRVRVNQSVSSWQDIPAGVQQGSVLGPLLFVIYTSDWPSSLRLSICGRLRFLQPVCRWHCSRQHARHSLRSSPCSSTCSHPYWWMVNSFVPLS